VRFIAVDYNSPDSCNAIILFSGHRRQQVAGSKFQADAGAYHRPPALWKITISANITHLDTMIGRDRLARWSHVHKWRGCTTATSAAQPDENTKRIRGLWF